MADHLQNTPIVEALIPRFKVPLRHQALGLETVLPEEKIHRAPSLVAGAVATVANDQLKSVFALPAEDQLMRQLWQLAGWNYQPEEFMVNHVEQTFFIAPHFSQELKSIYPADGQPPLVTWLDNGELIMATPDRQKGWKYLSTKPDRSDIKGLITVALRVIWEPAEPASGTILATCETATQDFRARH